MRWPWISRSMHAEVLAAKDEHISALRAQIASLEVKLATPVAVSVTLPENFAVLQPAVVQGPAKRTKKADKQPFSGINLAEVDENDERALAVLAIKYLGRKAHNKYELAQTVRTIQIQVRAARQEAQRQRAESAQEEPNVSNVPIHLREMIEEAARVN